MPRRLVARGVSVVGRPCHPLKLDSRAGSDQVVRCLFSGLEASRLARPFSEVRRSHFMIIGAEPEFGGIKSRPDRPFGRAGQACRSCLVKINWFVGKRVPSPTGERFTREERVTTGRNVSEGVASGGGKASRSWAGFQHPDSSRSRPFLWGEFKAPLPPPGQLA